MSKKPAVAKTPNKKKTKPPKRRRKNTPSKAIFGVIAKKAVTEVGEPSYTSGAQK